MPIKPKITKKAEWYYRRVGREYGPVMYGELRIMALDGRLHPKNDFVKTAKMEEWVPAAEVEGLISNAKKSEKIAKWRNQTTGGWLPIKVDKYVGITGFTLFSLSSCFLHFFINHQSDQFSASRYIEITMWLLFVAAIFSALEIIFKAWKAIHPFGVKPNETLAILVLFIPVVNLIVLFWLLPGWAYHFQKIRKSDKRLKKLPYLPTILFFPACLTPYLAIAGYLVDDLSAKLTFYCYTGLFLPWWIALFFMTLGINKLVKIYWEQKNFSM